MTRLETARLALRPVGPEDAEALSRHWNRPEVRRFLWDDEPVPIETVRTVVAQSERDFVRAGYGVWGLHVDGGGSPIGMCALRVVDGHDVVEVLYSLDPEHWGRGLATEAAREVLRHGFRACGLEEIWGGVDEGNDASVRVLERLGMTGPRTLRVGEREVAYRVVTRQAFGSA